jgi:uncharacterized protein YhhL (DUF1145 family)
MKNSALFSTAINSFDEANAQDPNHEIIEGKSYPKELIYAKRMTDRLYQFEPDASEALKLAVRCQHICRWEIPRSSYEMNKVGYIQWRNDLKKFHAKKAAEILKITGYDEVLINQVEFLLLKKKLKKNAETQTLEDVVCLVFLQHYLDDFSEKSESEKLMGIIQKTWKKMSGKGQKAALELKLSPKASTLISKALH